MICLIFNPLPRRLSNRQNRHCHLAGTLIGPYGFVFWRWLELGLGISCTVI
jgi:hypothetical protein